MRQIFMFPAVSNVLVSLSREQFQYFYRAKTQVNKHVTGLHTIL